MAATVARDPQAKIAGIGLGLALDRLGGLPATIFKRAAGVAGALAGIAILAG